MKIHAIFNFYYCSITVRILDFEAFRQSGFFRVGLGLVFSGLGRGLEGSGLVNIAGM